MRRLLPLVRSQTRLEIQIAVYGAIRYASLNFYSGTERYRPHFGPEAAADNERKSKGEVDVQPRNGLAQSRDSKADSFLTGTPVEIPMRFP